MNVIDDEEVCVDVHSSAFALAVVGAVVITAVLPLSLIHIFTA